MKRLYQMPKIPDLSMNVNMHQAQNLQEQFEREFWCEEIGSYALALDGKKRRCEVRSSNAGHCLFTNIASQDHARQTARTVEHMVKLSEQLNEALSQFRVAASAPTEIRSASEVAAAGRR